MEVSTYLGKKRPDGSPLRPTHITLLLLLYPVPDIGTGMHAHPSSTSRVVIMRSIYHDHGLTPATSLTLTRRASAFLPTGNPGPRLPTGPSLCTPWQLPCAARPTMRHGRPPRAGPSPLRAVRHCGACSIPSARTGIGRLSLFSK